MKSNSESLFAYFNDTTQDVYVYVRYLQIDQVERKSLSKQVRSIESISIDAALSIRHELKLGDHA
jgi:alkylhydroperoxidase/carboxymuconolactone decarboxylase family protein YurZ